MNWSLDSQVCFNLYKSSREIIRAYKDVLEPFHLTYTQYITMIALWEHDHQLVSELGTKLDLDSGTLTPLFKKLEKDQLIHRKRDEKDERKVWINLTEKGKALSIQAEVIPIQVANKFNVEPGLIEQLLKILKELKENYHE